MDNSGFFNEIAASDLKTLKSKIIPKDNDNSDNKIENNSSSIGDKNSSNIADKNFSSIADKNSSRIII